MEICTLRIPDPLQRREQDLHRGRGQRLPPAIIPAMISVPVVEGVAPVANDII